MVERLLERLHGVRKVSHGGWIARCPAHEDRSPSLSVTDADARVLIHCHAGCTAHEIVSAVGLELSDLFEPRADAYDRPQRKASFNAKAVLACLAEDSTLIYVAGTHIVQGEVLSPRDMTALLGAVERVREGARKAAAI